MLSPQSLGCAGGRHLCPSKTSRGLEVEAYMPGLEVPGPIPRVTWPRFKSWRHGLPALDLEQVI